MKLSKIKNAVSRKISASLQWKTRCGTWNPSTQARYQKCAKNRLQTCHRRPLLHLDHDWLLILFENLFMTLKNQ